MDMIDVNLRERSAHAFAVNDVRPTAPSLRKALDVDIRGDCGVISSPKRSRMFLVIWAVFCISKKKRSFQLFQASGFSCCWGGVIGCRSCARRRGVVMSWAPRPKKSSRKEARKPKEPAATRRPDNAPDNPLIWANHNRKSMRSQTVNFVNVEAVKNDGGIRLATSWQIIFQIGHFRSGPRANAFSPRLVSDRMLMLWWWRLRELSRGLPPNRCWCPGHRDGQFLDARWSRADPVEKRDLGWVVSTCFKADSLKKQKEAQLGDLGMCICTIFGGWIWIPTNRIVVTFRTVAIRFVVLDQRFWVR